MKTVKFTTEQLEVIHNALLSKKIDLSYKMEQDNPIMYEHMKRQIVEIELMILPLIK